LQRFHHVAVSLPLLCPKPAWLVLIGAKPVCAERLAAAADAVTVIKVKSERGGASNLIF
jgi:hypothetical protein